MASHHYQGDRELPLRNRVLFWVVVGAILAVCATVLVVR